MKRYFNIQNILIAVMSAFVIGSICRLGVLYGIVLGCSVFIFLPSFIKYIQKEKESYLRYTQASLYMEQMESSFKKNLRIYPSLKETLTLFDDGIMGDTIQSAVDVIETDTAGTEGMDSSEEALAVIEEKYGCEQMELMHSFFLRSQEQGGDFTKAVLVLEKRRNTWMDAVEQCRSEKKNMLFSVLLSFLLLFVVSEAIVLFLPAEMNIMELPLEKTIVIAEIVFLLFLARCALKKNATDWLSSITERTEEEIEKDYHFIEDYNPAKRMKTSIKWAFLPLILTTIIFVATKSITVFSVGFAITILLLNQHKLDYFLKKKRIKKEVERDFPRWMFHVILLMETESVQVAIHSSTPKAPAILKYPLERIWEQMQKDPIGATPYFEFLKDYDVPKVHEAMKILYSISSGTGGNVEEQMLNIIEKNNDMTLRSEKIKNDNKVAGMMGYLFLPVLPAGVKIMVDMVLVMITMYGTLGNVM